MECVNRMTMTIFLLVLIICEIVIYRKIDIDVNVKSISFIYGMGVSILLFISSLNPLNLYKVSEYTYFLIIISIISFMIAFCMISKKLIKKKPNLKIINKKIEKTLNKLLKSKIFISIVIINLILVIIYKMKYELVIQDLPKQEIRMARFNALFSSAFETLFFNYIITGIINILSIVFSICLVRKKLKNFLFVLIMCNILIYSLIGYGRIIYFNILLYIIITMLLSNNIRNYLNRKFLLKFVLFCFIVFVIFTAMVYMRIGKKNLSLGENIVLSLKNQTEQAIEYLVGEYRLLDNFVQKGFENFDFYTLGRATFAGVEEILLYPIKALGVQVESFNNDISYYTQKAILIGENNSYFNAYYTCIMNYYLDFGILGVIVYPILHSILILFALRNYYTQKNIFSLMLLNFVLLNLFFGVIRWNYQSGTTVFVLSILLLLNFFKNYKLSFNR